LVAYKYLDDLWKNFRRTHDDDKYEDLIQDKDLLVFLGGLDDLSDIFYSYFREDGYDPRVLSPIKKTIIGQSTPSWSQGNTKT